MLSSSKTTSSSWAIGIIPQQQRPPNFYDHRRYHRRTICHDSLVRKKNSNYNNNTNNNDIEIEVQWKEKTKNRHVRFDPSMDWKTESLKAEHGHLRRLAEKEIKKRLDIVQRKGKNIDWREHPQLLAELKLSKTDRQKEAFLYICFCNVQLLVGQYNQNNNTHSDSRVLARMFDLMFEEVGIKRPSERAQNHQLRSTKEPCTNSDAEENTDSSWLWTCFFAVQLEFRRIYEKGDTNNTPSRTTQPFVSGLSRKVDQALFFIHWLSPAFRYEEKESKQRQVYTCILGDIEAITRFEEYLYRDTKNESEDESLKDLRLEVHGLFGTLVHSSLVTSAQESSVVGTDLDTYFAAIRGKEVHAENLTKDCDWDCCCNKEYPHELPLSLFPYHSLTYESKRRLFLISAMPAFGAYLTKIVEDQQLIVLAQQKQQQCFESTQCSELMQSQLLGFSVSEDSTNNPCHSIGVLQQHPTNNDAAPTDANCDCPLKYDYDECEFTQGVCNLLFESA